MDVGHEGGRRPPSDLHYRLGTVAVEAEGHRTQRSDGGGADPIQRVALEEKATLCRCIVEDRGDV